MWVQGQESLTPAYLVLTQQRQMEEDFKRLSVSSKNDKLRNATVQSLGGCEAKAQIVNWVGVLHRALQQSCDEVGLTFVGTLAQLLVVGGFAHQIQDLEGQLVIGKRVCLRVYSAFLQSYKGKMDEYQCKKAQGEPVAATYSHCNGLIGNEMEPMEDWRN